MCDVGNHVRPRRHAECEDSTTATPRQRLKYLPLLTPDGLWPAQGTAILNLEHSLTHFRPRALIQMATGSGKTFTAANISYRLVKLSSPMLFAGAPSRAPTAATSRRSSGAASRSRTTSWPLSG